MGNEHGKEINHDDHDGEYAHFSRITRREVRFHVRAACTASVALTSADHVTDDLYEVHFGADGNTRCFIRSETTARRLALRREKLESGEIRTLHSFFSFS